MSNKITDVKYIASLTSYVNALRGSDPESPLRSPFECATTNGIVHPAVQPGLTLSMSIMFPSSLSPYCQD